MSGRLLSRRGAFGRRSGPLRSLRPDGGLTLGFKLAIFPASGFLAMGAALRSVYGEILEKGSTKAWTGELYSFDAFSRLMGFERVWAFEREYAET